MEERVSQQEALDYGDRVWEERVEKLRRGGLSYAAIAEALNRQGVTTANGKKWHATSISRLVRRKIESLSSGGPHDQLLSRALAGDRWSRRRIRDLLGFEDPTAEKEEAEMWERLRQAKNRVNEGYFDGVDELLTEAAEMGSCFLVQAHGIAAQRDRMRGDYRAANAHLANARVLAADCPDESCNAEVLRREANLLRARRRYRDALDRADSAIRAYETLGHAGHNLDGAGLESSLYIRAKIFYFLKRYKDSVKEFEVCLDRLDPDRHEVLYCCSTHGLAVALAEYLPRRKQWLFDKLMDSSHDAVSPVVMVQEYLDGVRGVPVEKVVGLGRPRRIRRRRSPGRGPAGCRRARRRDRHRHEDYAAAYEAFKECLCL